MCENVNINVSETNETINIVSSEIQEVIDINVFETTEDVTLNITEEIIQVNINKVTGGGEQTLEQTLEFGNNTGGTNILLNSTDSILLENNSSLRKGTYDFGQGGGISRICGVDYEDMWQGGIRHVFDTNGFIRNSTNGFNTVPNFSFDVTLRFKVGSIWTLDDGTNYICTDNTEGAAVWELYNEIPTNTSDLTNDGEDGVNPFITAADLPDVTGFVPYTGATQDVDLGEFEIKAGQVEFDQTPTGTAGVGVMRWNDADGTVDLGLKGGNVTLQIGQESVLRVVNKTATNVNLLEANYQAVRVTGAQGQRLKVDLAQATTDNLSAETIGLVTETINNNQEGFITTSGLVRDINTTGSLQGETWADGDILYLSPTTAGRATKVKPTAPNHLVILGYVIHAHVNQGSIFVKVDNGYELDELHNVKITSAANNNVLAYTSATDIWENKTINTVIGYTPFQLPALTSGSVLFSNGTTIAQDNANLFWDDTNNRLGIGTNNPSAYYAKKLVIAAPDEDGVTILANSVSSSSYVAFADGATGNEAFRGYLSYKHLSDQLAFGSAGSLRMTLTSGGNLLLNTTTDAGFKLDVNGTARVSGVLSLTNSGVGLNYDSGVGVLLGAVTNAPGGGWKVSLIDNGNNIYGAFGSSSSILSDRSGAGRAALTGTSAVLELQSTTRGFLPPRMTTTQKNAIATPAAGLVVYDTTLAKLCVRTASAWETITSI
jgi:hypothetical protein